MKIIPGVKQIFIPSGGPTGHVDARNDNQGARDDLTDELRQRVLRDRIVQRAEVPEDLVGTAIFLASHESDFITGQVIHVDGGSVLGK